MFFLSIVLWYVFHFTMLLKTFYRKEKKKIAKYPSYLFFLSHFSRFFFFINLVAVAALRLLWYFNACVIVLLEIHIHFSLSRSPFLSLTHAHCDKCLYWNQQRFVSPISDAIISSDAFFYFLLSILCFCVWKEWKWQWNFIDDWIDIVNLKSHWSNIIRDM